MASEDRTEHTEFHEKPPAIDGRDADSSDSGKSQMEGDKEAGEEYKLSGVILGLILSGLGLMVFLIALDTAIVATASPANQIQSSRIDNYDQAIPIISERFHSTEDIGWYGSAYLLTVLVCITLPSRFPWC